MAGKSTRWGDWPPEGGFEKRPVFVDGLGDGLVSHVVQVQNDGANDQSFLRPGVLCFLFRWRVSQQLTHQSLMHLFGGNGFKSDKLLQATQAQAVWLLRL